MSSATKRIAKDLIEAYEKYIGPQESNEDDYEDLENFACLYAMASGIPNNEPITIKQMYEKAMKEIKRNEN